MVYHFEKGGCDIRQFFINGEVYKVTKNKIIFLQSEKPERRERTARLFDSIGL